MCISNRHCENVIFKRPNNISKQRSLNKVPYNWTNTPHFSRINFCNCECFVTKSILAYIQQRQYWLLIVVDQSLASFIDYSYTTLRRRLEEKMPDSKNFLMRERSSYQSRLISASQNNQYDDSFCQNRSKKDPDDWRWAHTCTRTLTSFAQ